MKFLSWKEGVFGRQLGVEGAVAAVTHHPVVLREGALAVRVREVEAVGDGSGGGALGLAALHDGVGIVLKVVVPHERHEGGEVLDLKQQNDGACGVS